MISIRLLMLGKNKDAATEALVQDFQQRLQGFCSLELVYLKDERVHDDIDKVLSKEAETLRKAFRPDEYLVVLDEKGQSLSTKAFYDRFFELVDRHTGRFTFVIGSSHGLAQEIKDQADLRLSLSPLTMNHQIVRILFLEQLYRIFTIRRGMQYHK